MSKREVLSEFTILCWAAFIATLGRMQPSGHGLDAPRAISTHIQISQNLVTQLYLGIESLEKVNLCLATMSPPKVWGSYFSNKREHLEVSTTTTLPY